MFCIAANRMEVGEGKLIEIIMIPVGCLISYANNVTVVVRSIHQTEEEAMNELRDVSAKAQAFLDGTGKPFEPAKPMDCYFAWVVSHMDEDAIFMEVHIVPYQLRQTLSAGEDLIILAAGCTKAEALQFGDNELTKRLVYETYLAYQPPPGQGIA